ncbi:branched-chain amino acid ABC transporter permease [Carboxydochorda subterranea]|uniref:Branched-chain amino acid ABC transporter permease n=1 Tax=Carboxydichorda subterranea TaxID=3109565 RepID=A0ABZ1BYP8_9FIRM|nr:branched-chain amino acid ABC transporter permease [Limnochorda sp. L945t]WRP17922.1 branched-chain amino acid ABC transporter permease [Limnochorda sp. L945t]
MASLLAWGVMLGGILALGGVGLSLVYGVLRFATFAHGDLMTVGAYLVATILPALPPMGRVGPFSFGWEFLVALALAMPLTGMVALAMDRAFYRPLRRRQASPLILAMASLGVAFLLRSLVYLGWGADFRFYYPGRARPSVLLPLGVRLRPDQLFILGVTVVLVVLMYLLLERTRAGKAMRATADNPALARVSGIDTERVAAWTWLVSGALAAAAGAMLALDSQLRPEMGWFLLLSLFAAVVLGGLGKVYAALAGGLVMGVVQQVATAFLNPAYGPAVGFVVLAALLVFKPEGLLGGRGMR